MKRLIREQGFTLIELLMAMAVFSFMLIIVATGFVQVVRVYQSGIASRTTQQNARLIMDDIVKLIRTSEAAVVVDDSVFYSHVCLTRNGQLLEYGIDASGNLRQGVITDDTCPLPVFDSSWRVVNDPAVQVTNFRLDTTPPNNNGLGTVFVTLTLASLNNLGNLNATKDACLPGVGSQFCAVTTLSSTASLRGGEGQ